MIHNGIEINLGNFILNRYLLMTKAITNQRTKYTSTSIIKWLKIIINSIELQQGYSYINGNHPLIILSVPSTSKTYHHFVKIVNEINVSGIDIFSIFFILFLFSVHYNKSNRYFFTTSFFCVCCFV